MEIQFIIAELIFLRLTLRWDPLWITVFIWKKLSLLLLLATLCRHSWSQPKEGHSTHWHDSLALFSKWATGIFCPLSFLSLLHNVCTLLHWLVLHHSSSYSIHSHNFFFHTPALISADRSSFPPFGFSQKKNSKALHAILCIFWKCQMFLRSSESLDKI